MALRLLFQLLAAMLAVPDLRPVVEEPVADPRRLATPGAHDHQPGHRQGRGLLDDPAGPAPCMPEDPEHLPALAAILAADHFHRVALAQVEPGPFRHHCHRSASGRRQSTSGASEMIFMNCLSRSSRATGPKMRVPRGSPVGWITTAALSSNRSTEPSGR